MYKPKHILFFLIVIILSILLYIAYKEYNGNTEGFESTTVTPNSIINFTIDDLFPSSYKQIMNSINYNTYNPNNPPYLYYDTNDTLANKIIKSISISNDTLDVIPFFNPHSTNYDQKVSLNDLNTLIKNDNSILGFTIDYVTLLDLIDDVSNNGSFTNDTKLFYTFTELTDNWISSSDSQFRTFDTLKSKYIKKDDSFNWSSGFKVSELCMYRGAHELAKEDSTNNFNTSLKTNLTNQTGVITALRDICKLINCDKEKNNFEQRLDWCANTPERWATGSIPSDDTQSSLTTIRGSVYNTGDSIQRIFFLKDRLNTWLSKHLPTITTSPTTVTPTIAAPTTEDPIVPYCDTSNSFKMRTSDKGGYTTQQECINDCRRQLKQFQNNPNKTFCLEECTIACSKEKKGQCKPSTENTYKVCKWLNDAKYNPPPPINTVEVLNQTVSHNDPEISYNISINWYEPTEDIDNYYIEFSESGKRTPFTIINPIVSNKLVTYVFNSLKYDTHYKLKLYSQNKHGLSKPSKYIHIPALSINTRKNKSVPIINTSNKQISLQNFVEAYLNNHLNNKSKEIKLTIE